MIPSVSRKETVVPVGRLNRVRFGILALAALVLVGFFAPSYSNAQPPCTPTPRLVVTVGDTSGAPCLLNSVITVSLDNQGTPTVKDTVAGFSLLLFLDRPDILRFQTDTITVIDTSKWDCTAGSPPNCTDSVQLANNSPTWDMRYIDTNDVIIGDIDTAGTLISGWEFLQTRVSGLGTSILITAFADQLGGPVRPPIYPQPGGVLFRLRGDIQCTIPDTLTDRTVKVQVEDNITDKFLFSRPNGTTIGTWTQTTLDTVCWRCVQLVGQTCVDYDRVSTPPCDSTSYQTLNSLKIDTCYMKAFDGSLTALASCCSGTTGNLDNDPGDAVDISDLQILIDFLFFNGGLGPCMDENNVDRDPGQSVDITDLQYVIDYLFFGGSLPGC